MKRVGFWKGSLFDGLPDPRRLVDVTWDPHERALVVAYLKAGREANAFFGYSHCRFECGKQDRDLGCHDLTDDVYVWPEGYAHYIEDHGVRPPADFVAHVMKRSGT